MASNPADIVIIGTAVRPVTPETVPIHLEPAPEDAQAEQQGTNRTPAQANFSVATAVANPVALLAQAAVRAPIEPTPDNTFVFYVGGHFTAFKVNINDMRRESPLFRSSVCITSIMLRQENPDAVQLIQRWFSGYIGIPPMTKEDRDLYMDAARIARQLQIRECESQLIVIVRKTISSMACLMSDQIARGRPMTPNQIADLVSIDMQGYMIRSTNEGGEDDLEDF